MSLAPWIFHLIPALCLWSLCSWSYECIWFSNTCGPVYGAKQFTWCVL